MDASHQLHPWLGFMNLRMRFTLPFILAVCVFACSEGGGGKETFGGKHEWSILQVVEDQWRSKPITSPEFHSVEGHELLSLPSLSGSKRIWIMLQPQVPPFYKQMPAGNYVISEALVNNLVRSGRVTSTVEESMRSHIGE